MHLDARSSLGDGLQVKRERESPSRLKDRREEKISGDSRRPSWSLGLPTTTS